MTTTVIDALLVTLGLDKRDFEKGRKDTEKDLERLKKKTHETSKYMDERGKEAAQFFTRVRNEALAMFAVLAVGGGLKSFVENTIDSAVQLGFMSENLNMSTRRLQAWQRAAERSGSSAQAITNALKQSADEVNRFKTGMSSEQMQWFFRMGGSTGDLKDGNSYLLARARIIHELFKVDPTRAMFVANQMGITDDQLNLIKQGPDAILKLVAAQEKNSAIGKKQAQEALELQRRWLDLRDRLQATTQTILLRLAPALEHGMRILQKWADWIADHRDDISKWIDTAAHKVEQFVDWANKAAESVGGWKRVLEGLAALKLISMTSGLLSLAGALIRVGAGLAGLGGAGTLGMAVLGRLGLVGAAGAAGVWVGGKIYDHMGGKSKDIVGMLMARTLAAFGNHDAAEAIRINTGHDDYLSNPNNAKAVQTLMAKGWTRAQASGLVGNFARESGLNPHAVGDNGKAYGIGQWHPDRQADFKKLFGKDIRNSTLDEQLAFANYELRFGRERAAGSRLAGAKDAYSAGAIVSAYYERPANAAAEASRRAQAAASIYDTTASMGALAVGRMGARPMVAGGHSSTVTNNATIGKIEIKTAATDANGIARDIGPALQKYNLASQANRGLE